MLVVSPRFERAEWGKGFFAPVFFNQVAFMLLSFLRFRAIDFRASFIEAPKPFQWGPKGDSCSNSVVDGSFMLVNYVL